MIDLFESGNIDECEEIEMKKLCSARKEKEDFTLLYNREERLE